MSGRKPISIDPLVSIAVFAAIGVAALFVLRSIAAMAALFAYVALLYSAVGGGADGRRRLGRNLLSLWWMVGLIVVLNGILLAGDPLVAVGGRTIVSRQGLSAGVFFSLRLLVLYVSVVTLMAATPPVEFASGVYRLIRPVSRDLANRAAFQGFLVLSFLPLFSDELARVRLAQAYRGADLSGGIVGRAAAVRALVVPLVVSAIHRSGELAAVIELRGLRERMGALVPVGRPGARDVALVLATAAVLAAIALVVEKGRV